MDDVGTMAIVDARKDLLHENGSVTLREFSAVQDFVEELTALADSVQKSVTILKKYQRKKTYSVTR